MSLESKLCLDCLLEDSMTSWNIAKQIETPSYLEDLGVKRFVDTSSHMKALRSSTMIHFLDQ